MLVEAAAGKESRITYTGMETESGPQNPFFNITLLRRFVYGLDYIDEVVAQFVTQYEDEVDCQVVTGTDVRFVLQDANYNVVDRGL